MEIKIEIPDLLICHKCKGVLLEAHMGHECPYCHEWTYTHLSIKALKELEENK